jgi:hypothetical protein
MAAEGAEETEPEGTEPEGTEPEGTEPEGTEPEATAGTDGAAPDGAEGTEGTDADGVGAEGSGVDADGTGAGGAPPGAFGMPACSKKYGVALGVRESALNISSSGVGVPKSSAKSVGAGRMSASFGNGLAARGGE